MKKILLAILLCLILCTPCGAQRLIRPDCSEWFSIPETYGYTYSEHMVEGADGCSLLTRIYLPEGEGPWPVIVTRTAYVFLRRGDTDILGREYARRGIGYIKQDCRGRGGSEGCFDPYIHEREDGKALYHWLEEQEWCGSIGIYGSGYSAFTGWIVADCLPGKVKGLHLSRGGVDRHVSCYRSGLFRMDAVSGWMIDHSGKPLLRPKRADGSQAEGEEFYSFYLDRPHFHSDAAILGQELREYRDWISHPDYCDPYWNSGVWGELKSIPSRVNVPVTVVAGQFDCDWESTLLGWERLPAETQRRSRLIIGPWDSRFKITPTHVPTAHAGDFDVNKDLFVWFHSLLVREQEPDSGIKAYVIGEDRWMSLNHWPAKASRQKKFYLGGRRAASQHNVFMLSDSKGKKAVLCYDYDPADPVMTAGGESIGGSPERGGSVRQPKLGYREDLLSFVSAPLKEDMKIAGNVRVRLHVSSDADDSAFAFTISEITPSGACYNIRTSIATLAYRGDALGKRQVYKKGKEAELEIVSSPVVWTVKKGNFLRIDVKSSSFPEYSVHTNTAGVWSLQSETRVAHQKVFAGGKKASVLILPLL